MDQGDKFDMNFDVDSVFEQLTNLNQNEAPSPDGIHPKILKNCAKCLAYPLFLLYNQSYMSGDISSE